MGLDRDLKLKGNEFTNAATAFPVAYLVAEVPNGISHYIPLLSLALSNQKSILTYS